jgi:hypothetical protein
MGREATKGREGGAGRWREEDEGKEKRELSQFVMFKKNRISSFCHSRPHAAVPSAAACEHLMDRGGVEWEGGNERSRGRGRTPEGGRKRGRKSENRVSLS